MDVLKCNGLAFSCFCLDFDAQLIYFVLSKLVVHKLDVRKIYQILPSNRHHDISFLDAWARFVFD